MGRYELLLHPIKPQKITIDKSKLWFKDVQYIEDTLNKIKKDIKIEPGTFLDYRFQIRAMILDLEECVGAMGNYFTRHKSENRDIIELKIKIIRNAVEKLSKKCYGG